MQSGPAGVIKIVLPSGFDLATKSAPTLPFAPGLVSTSTGWPNIWESLAATGRAITSLVPPAW